MASIMPYYNADGVLTAYRIRVYDGRDQNGKQHKAKRMTFKVEPTWSEKTARKKAEARASVFEAECKSGKNYDSAYTFAEYCDYVIGLKESREKKQSTLYNYQNLAKRVCAEIGNIKLVDLTTHKINQLLTSLSQAENAHCTDRAVPKTPFGELLKQKNMTRKDLSALSGVALHTVAETVNGRETSIASAQKIANALGKDTKTLFTFRTTEKSKLSTTTICRCQEFVHTVLAQAVNEGIIPCNYADKVERFTKKKRDVNFFDLDQIKTIEDQLENAPQKWATMVNLFLATGCRRGEILALTWNDIDLELGEVYVHSNLLYTPSKGIYFETPKTKNSERKLQLPEKMLAQLTAYKRWQSEERLRLGSVYQNEGLLFTRDNGTPMHPDSVNDWMRKFGERCGFHINPHAFRHTFASILIFSGLDIVSVSKLLGHSNVETTMNIYAHLIMRPEQKGAEALDDFFDKLDNRGIG